MPKQTVRDVEWSGKRALVRVDFNVPFERDPDGSQSARISDDIRIREALPTINYLRERGAGVLLCTHLGRPGGHVDPSLELGPIAARLAELLGTPVSYVHDAPGEAARHAAGELPAGEVAILENIRFWPGEEANDPDFARALADLADAYVNDAFGTAHRAHASTAGVASFLPAVAGLLMDKELTFLGGALHEPKRPMAAVLGGAKVSDKLKVLQRLIGHADALLVGGGMAATFLKAGGLPVGASLVEDDLVDACAAMLIDAEDKGTRLELPTDVVVAERIEAGTETRAIPASDIPDGWMVLDIGPGTALRYADLLATLGTVVWNGPMGVFEVPPFDAGTRAVADAIAHSAAVSIIGGGSTAEAVGRLGLADRMTHVSTGGGASLEFLEGRELPGVAALADA